MFLLKREKSSNLILGHVFTSLHVFRLFWTFLALTASLCKQSNIFITFQSISEKILKSQQVCQQCFFSNGILPLDDQEKSSATCMKHFCEKNIHQSCQISRENDLSHIQIINSSRLPKIYIISSLKPPTCEKFEQQKEHSKKIILPTNNKPQYGDQIKAQNDFENQVEFLIIKFLPSDDVCQVF